VAARLGRAPFPELFARLGIHNLSTAGLQVVTTVDVNLQRDATYGLWHHLTEAGAVLEGMDLSGFLLPEARAPRHDPDRELVPHEFRDALIVEPPEEAEALSIHLDLGAFPCTVDAEGVERAATILARSESGERWRKSTDKEQAALVEALAPGQVLWVSVREPGICDLEVRPELQGAVLALDEGRILAMVGGNDNRNFNRALHARRQMGSTWKPLVFQAASQLGWSTVDLLDNRENVFHFEGTWYYPRPDHQSEPFVSMAWAGTRSENLASIWLLDHLTDRLDGREFKKVARLVGLAPGINEDRRAFITRIRDDYGVIATASRMPEVAFQTAKAEALATVDVGSREAVELLSLRYGRGVAAEAARQRETATGRDLSRKLLALGHNHQRLNKQALACDEQARRLLKLEQEGVDGANSAGGFVFRGRANSGSPNPPEASDLSDLRVRPWFGSLQLACGEADDKWGRVTDRLLLLVARGASAPFSDPEEMWVDGRLRMSTIKTIRRGMERRLLVFQGVDPYELEYLQHHPDYRRLVNMRYVAFLARRFGVEGELPPVMSMPLGALDISLEELAQVYQGMRLGKNWTFSGMTTEPGAVPGLRRTVRVPASEDATLLISEIRDRHGNVLYRAVPKAKSVVGEPDVGRLTADILRNVVRWGTGRRALGVVTIGKHPVPVAGKTGTTNGYRNAAFAGYVPKVRDGSWRFGEGYTLVSYVGYDDNRSMSRGGTRITGASGALPPWITTAQSMADHGLIGEASDLVNDMGVVALEWPAAGNMLRLGVLDRSGLIDAEALVEGVTVADRTVLIREGREPFSNGVELERLFAPFRRGGMGPPPTEDERRDGGGEASVLPGPA